MSDKVIRCEKCGNSWGYCVTTGCRPLKKNVNARTIAKILARECAGFEDA